MDKIQSSKNYVVKAFTLMEMLIVMVLISIVFSAGAFLYLQFNKYLTSSINSSYAETELIQFNQAFLNDINRFSVTQVLGNAIQIRFSKDSVITYKFNNQEIVRSFSEIADTFHIKVDNLSIEKDRYTDEFTSIKADLMINENSFPFFYFRTRENAELFNKFKD